MSAQEQQQSFLQQRIDALERENKRVKSLRHEGAEIAKAFQKETGMVWGERIGLFLKDVEGKPFSVKDYHMERLPGEQ